MDAQHLLATQEENTPQRLLRKQTSYDVWSEKRDQLLLKERTYQQQYSNFYFQRLVQLKPHVTAEAKHRWSHLSGKSFIFASDHGY
jgi:DNA polymerase II small subunit/DNA polymerase delta subunit B